MGGRVLASVTLVYCLATSCSFFDTAAPRPADDSSTAPVNSSGVAYLGGTGTYDQGCATFEVTVSGSSSITVTTVAGSTCGSIQPVVSGTSTWSSSTRKAKLSIALKNVGTNTYLPPASLISWPDSLRQITPAPPPTISMTFTNPDVVNPDTASIYPSARIWKYDTMLVSNATLLQRLDPGKTSRARLVEVTLGNSLTKFRVALKAEGQLVDFTVPSVAPDSLPTVVAKAIYASANIVTADSAVTGRFPRNIVTVLFRSNATPSDRQAAIASISGEVVGGLQPGDVYYIRIRDNGGTAPLHAAWRALQANPKVEIAAPDLLTGGPTWLAPNDGNNWKKSNWKLVPLSAVGQPLAQQAIALPMAWGCETGSTSIRVAVVDVGFYGIADLQNNITSRSLGVLGKDPGDHGSFVASLIGAEGNNDVGISGAMWHAQLDYYDASKGASLPADSGRGPWERVHQQFIAAGLSGAPIINLSIGQNWLINVGRRPAPTGVNFQPDTTSRSVVARLMTRALRVVHDSGFFPLVVVAAGNDSVDVWWTGTSALRDFDSTRVIVVGGSRDADPTHGPFRKTYPGHDAFASNFGSRVDIAAVGSAYGLNKNGVVKADTGTSFAAPLVTGIAGLLLSANPTLPADSLKFLVLRGAQRDPRGQVAQMGGAKIANAYESLRAAAERTDGPLCGNRVWTTSNELWIQRDSTRDEQLYASSNWIGYPATVHGGRRIPFLALDGGRFDIKVVAFNGINWSLATPTGPDSVVAPPGASGAYQGFRGLSHNEDSISYAFPYPSAQKPWGPYRVTVYRVANGQTATVWDKSRTVPSDVRCLWSNSSGCQQQMDLPATSLMQDNPYPAVAYHPMGDSVIVSIPFLGYEYLGATETQCPWPPDPQVVCYSHQYRLRVDSSTVYRLRTTTNATPIRLWSQPGLIVSIAVSEVGEGHVMTVAMSTAFNDVQRSLYYGESTLQEIRTGCSTQFRRNYSSIPDKTYVNSLCEDYGLFAPRRASDRPPISVP